MKKKQGLNIYLVICMVLCIMVFTFFTLGMIVEYADGEIDYGHMFLILDLIPISLFITNLIGYMHNKQEKPNILRNAILFKASFFFLFFGLVYILPLFDDGIYAFCVFMGMGIILLIVSILLYRTKTTILNMNVNNNSILLYDGYAHYNEAENEYKRITGKETLPVQDRQDVLFYASQPIIYLLRWLLENQWMIHPYDKDISTLLRKRYDYTLRLENIKEDIHPFIMDYIYPEETFSYMTECFLYDLSSIMSKSQYFYCIKYSDALYEEWRKRLDKHFNHYYTQESYIERNVDYKVYCEYFDTNLKVKTLGDVSKEDIFETVVMINQLSDIQKKNLRLTLHELTDKDYHFSPDCIEVIEKKDDQCACHLIETKENGYSITIRDGVIIHGGDNDKTVSPFGRKMTKIYELLNISIDVESLTDEMIEEETEKGTLVRRDNHILTRQAENMVKECLIQINHLKQLGVISSERIDYIYNGNKVPDFIKINGLNNEGKLLYYQEVIVWG